MSEQPEGAPRPERYLPGDATDRAYEVRVAGSVPTAALLELGDVEVAEQELRTVLSGRFTDQAALYGFLHRLRALGLDVVEVRRVARGDDDEPSLEREAPESTPEEGS
jgi:hypothetical protein